MRTFDAKQEVEAAITGYRYMTSLPKPSKMNKRSVAYWMDGNKPLVKRESEYLERDADLVSLAIGDDRGKFDDIVEWVFNRYLPTRVGNLV
jgi:hypothetical protein